MATLSDLTETDVLATSAALGEPEWLRDRRLQAFKAYLDLPWPTVRDEAWRYTDPRRFDLDAPIVTATGRAPARAEGITDRASELCGLVRIVDGGVALATGCADGVEQGVIVCDLATAAREHPDLVRDALGAAVGHDEKLDALNLAAFTCGAFVHVPREVELARPIAVTLQVTQPGAVVPRVLVALGPNARATVLIDHSGEPADGRTTVVEVVEVVLAEGAGAKVVTAQEWGLRVDHIGTHRGRVGSNADYRHFEATLGGGTVYLRPDVELAEQGGSAELLGAYLTDSGQHVEHRSLIHHDASRTSSNLVYKGALQGESRGTFFGNIRIEPHAKATASDQTNRNLILSDGAHADSIPFLEILCSDVARCGHHSSVGQVDQMQLFYLESRGIPRPEAARLLVYGFFAEVTDRFGLPQVRDVVLARVERAIVEGPAALLTA